jgi:hypothetical protein
MNKNGICTIETSLDLSPFNLEKSAALVKGLDSLSIPFALADQFQPNIKVTQLEVTLAQFICRIVHLGFI